jgi:hypothetical protein
MRMHLDGVPSRVFLYQFLDPLSGKNNQYFSFMWKRRRNFYFFFIRISIVLDKSSFLPFPQTCEHSVLLGSSRFPMLSVDVACAFAFSPGSEGLTSDRLELYGVLLPLRSFSFVSSGLTQPEGINPAKDLWKPSPFSLMIVWSLDL